MEEILGHSGSERRWTTLMWYSRSSKKVLDSPRRMFSDDVLRRCSPRRMFSSQNVLIAECLSSMTMQMGRKEIETCFVIVDIGSTTPGRRTRVNCRRMTWVQEFVVVVVEDEKYYLQKN